MIHTDTNSKWVPLSQCPEFDPMVGGPPVVNSNINQPIAGHGLVIPRNPNAKSKIAAGILGILLPGTGVYRFYLGYIGIGIAQILANLFCLTGVLWGFIEGIPILCGSTITTDADGIPLTD